MSSNRSVALESKLPDWFVEDLGPLGVPYTKPQDDRVPPRESDCILFTEDHLKKGNNVKELSGGVYWVSSGWNDCMFIRTCAGVVAVDAPPALGENLLTAIEADEITGAGVALRLRGH